MVRGKYARGCQRERGRQAKFEPLEQRLVLTALLRPGAVPDALTLTPNQGDDTLALTSGPISPGVRDSAPVSTIDLSQVTADDQRFYGEGQSAAWLRVDTAQVYRFTASPSPELDEDSYGLLRIDSYDVDRQPIEAIHVSKFATAIDTTLAADLAPGDHFLLLSDASGWSDKPWESAQSRALAWYGYADRTGNVYDDFTYTRNVATGGNDGLWAADSIWYDPSVAAYRVPLLEPWSGPNLPAGAAVRNATSGIDFLQPLLDLSSDNTRWPTLTASIAGEWHDGQRDEHTFLPGTAFVRPYSVGSAVWDDATFGPASDFDLAGETITASPSRQFTLQLDAIAKEAFDTDGVIPGDFNGDFFVNAADYTVWRDGLGDTGAGDLGEYEAWQENFGKSGSGSIVLENVSAEFGTATVVTGGATDAIEYQSPEWFVGTDLVSYALRDSVTGEVFESHVAVTAAGSNYQQDAAVAATIEAQSQTTMGNAAPTMLGHDPAYSTEAGGVLMGSDLLASFADPTDALVARLVQGPAHGALHLNFDGTFEYLPKDGFTGTDTFRFKAFDGVHGVTGVATVEVLSDDELIDSRLLDVALGMLNYESAFDRFPIDNNPDYFDANGQPYLSWRVHMLQYTNHRSLYQQFNLDEPWDSAHNLPLLDQMPDLYRYPGDAADSTTTRLQTFNGNGAPFGSRSAGEDQTGPRLGEFAQDGPSNTVLVAQTAADVAVPWTQPVDLAFDPGDPLAALVTFENEPLWMIMADGSRLTLSAAIVPETFEALVTNRGEEVIDALTLQREYRFSTNMEIPAFKDRSREDSYMRNLALATLNYLDVRGRFPIADRDYLDDEGNPFLSWRVHILPFLNHENLYDRFNLDEPWDSENNLPLLAEMPDIFRSEFDGPDSTTTRVQRFTGPDAPFDREPEGQDKLGPRPFHIVDGFENTLLYIETAADRAVPWTQPADLEFDPDDPLAGIDLSADSIRTVFFDSSVVQLDPKMPEGAFAAMVTRAGRETVDPSRYAARDGGFKIPANLQNDFKQIALGMLDYEQARLRLPADRFAEDGSPLLSWRVEILPFIEQQNLYNQFRRDEPWDSPHNLSLLEFMPDVFRGIGDPANSATTRVHTFVGPNAPFPAEGQTNLRGVELRNVTDGIHNTIAFVEAGVENATPWTKPGGLPLYVHSPFSPLGELGGEFVAAFLDGHVETLSTGITPGTLRSLVTPSGDDDPDNPIELPLAPSITIIQTGGDTITNEFGVDLIHVVLDAPPSADVVVDVNSSDTSIATLDKSQLTFAPDNWDTPQRVAVRGVDNFEVNADQVINVSVVVNDSLSAVEYRNLFTFALFVTIADDEPSPPAVVGDYNGDGAVTLADYTVWRDNVGTANIEPYTASDANGDGEVGAPDYTAWQTSVIGGVSISAAGYQSPITKASTPASGRSATSSAIVPRSFDQALLLLFGSTPTESSAPRENDTGSNRSEEQSDVLKTVLSDLL